MRKFLSLVMAMIMVMSLVTVSAGAEAVFTDDEDIQYTEAVEVINAIGVVDGYKDGSFNPQNGLTRQAAAKIICNIILGPTTAAELSADTAPYPDVPITNEFAGYIAYLSKEGIISGYADGTFKGGNPLTGYAFMKMLLGVAGYDAEIEGYTGANWSVNVAKQAIGIGMDDGLVDEFNGIDYLTREEACLYAFNTLKATVVRYGQKTTVTTGGTTVVVSNAEETPETNNDFDYRDNHLTGAWRTGYSDNVMQVVEKYFPNVRLDPTDEDVFERPANTWYKKRDSIGTYNKEATLTYTADVKAETIYNDLDLNDAYVYDLFVDGVGLLKFDVEKRNDSAPVVSGANYNTYGQKINRALQNFYGDTTYDPGEYFVGNGSLIQVYEDEQRITVINTYLMQVNGDYDEKNEELDVVELDDPDPVYAPQKVANLNYGADADVLVLDDFPNLPDFSDEDYVKVTVANGFIQTIELAETTVAPITEYVHTESLTAGDVYNYSAANADNNKAYSLKEDYNLYLDDYGYVLWADGVDVAEQYVFIYEFAPATNLTTATTVVANAYFTDGTNETISINKLGTEKLRANMVTNLAGNEDGRDSLLTVKGVEYSTGWYQWKQNENGSYNLTALADQTYYGVATADGDAEIGVLFNNNSEKITNYDDQHTLIADGSTVMEGNKNTLFVIRDEDGDVYTYTGIKNVPDITSGVSSDTRTDMYWANGYVKTVFVDLGANGTMTGGNISGDTIFFYKRANDANDPDDVDYYTYKAIVNGELKNVRVDHEDDIAGNWGVYTNVEYNEKGYMVQGDEIETIGPGNYAYANLRKDFTYQNGLDAADLSFNQKGNTLIITESGVGDKNYYMADDCVIYVYHRATDTLDENVRTAELRKDGLPAGTTWAIHGVLNGDNEYTHIFFFT